MQRWLIFLGFSLLLSGVLHAQRSTAATLTVRYGPVEVLRAGTQSWLSLSAGAEMPFSSGDAVRTRKDSGRALLTLEGVRWLILPNSELRLEYYRALSLGEAIIEARISGVLVTSVSPGSELGYQLHTPTFTVTRPGTLAALWTGPEWPASYIVAEGEAVLLADDSETRLSAGQGIEVRDGSADVTALEQPYNAARLQSLLYGCAARVTTNGERLIVRRGPATNFLSLDALSNGYDVTLLGQTERSGWSRIQYLSGFSWIFTRALTPDEGCTRTLPTFPDSTPQESIITAYNIDEAERALLTPFFGDPKDNYLFYQTK